MSWRSPGGFRPRRPSSGYRPGGTQPNSIFSAGGSDGPSLPVLIIAALVVGVVALGLMIAFGGRAGQQTATTPQQPTAPPAAPPTETPAAQPTEAPTAQATPAAQATATPAAQATATPAAQATATPAAQATATPRSRRGAAEIPTEPYGPALASGQGTPVELGTDVSLLIFDREEITVPNGLVTLTFKNMAEAVQHNWVLVNGGDDVAKEINAAAQAQSRAARSAEGALPPADTPGLLLATPMLNPGEEITVTFQPPGPGTYEFICTFPGHYEAGMRGKLIVR